MPAIHPYCSREMVLLTPRDFAKLLFNHMDAWMVALIIAILALLIHNMVTPRTTLLLVAIATGYWLAFAANDYYDAPFDALDRRKAKRNFFVSRTVSRKVRWLVLLPLCTFLFIVFVQFGTRGIVVLALCFFVMWSYSAPPLRLKSRPGIDWLLHAVFVETFPYLICLVLTRVTWTRLDAVMLSILFLASLTAQVEQQARDWQTDVKAGGSFVTRIGIAPTAVFLRTATLLLILFALCNVIQGVFPIYILPFGLIGLPALLHRFIRRQEQPRSERLVFISVAIGLLYTVTIFVYFLLK